MSACSERELAKFQYQSFGGMQSAAGTIAFGLGLGAKVAPHPGVKAAFAVLGGVSGAAGLAFGYAENHFRAKYDGLEEACQREKAQQNNNVPKVEAPSGGGGGSYYGGSSGGYMPSSSFSYYYERGHSYTDSQGTIHVQPGHWVKRMHPITIDLDLDGSTFTNAKSHSADLDGDGRFERYTLPGSSDGVLVYDHNQDGIGQTNEWGLTSFVPGAKSDYEALLAFNSNGNNKIDRGDQEFEKLKIGIDANGNGKFDAGELHSIEEFFDSIQVVTNIGNNLNEEMLPGVIRQDTGWTKVGGNDDYSSWDGVALGIEASYNSIYGDGNADVVNLGDKNALVWKTDNAATINLSNLNYGGSSNFSDAYMGGGSDQIYGSEGNNIISGGDGADVILGNGGDDIIVADRADFESGNVNGGSGYDVLMLAENVGQRIYLNARGFEAAIGSEASDTIDASGLSSSAIYASAGDDIIFGSGGRDVIAGGIGNDYMAGGDGDDVYLFDSPPNVENAGIQHDVVYDTGGFDTLHFLNHARSDLNDIYKNGNDYIVRFKDGSDVRIVGSGGGVPIEQMSFNDSTASYDMSVLYNVIV